jgi:Cu-Zn family superoxide dismutase
VNCRLGLVVLSSVVLTAAACTPPQSWPTPEPEASPTPTKPAPARVPPPAPFSGTTATAVLRDLAGRGVGSVTFTDTRAGLLLSGDVKNIGLGPHGIHIHEIGKCESPFTSAGGHYNPTARKHGYKAVDGPHLGDLPNIDVPAAARLHFDFLLPDVSLKGRHALLDGDGASIVIHGASDDYTTDPAGNSGGRIACGVILLK